MVRSVLGLRDHHRRDWCRSKIYGELDWATKTQVDSFTASAQRVRHARSTAVPPRELSLTKAHDLVSALVAKWAAMLAAKG